jgi:regulator of protease activity HflC (stomatin/prohibitin superfamily)
VRKAFLWVLPSVLLLGCGTTIQPGQMGLKFVRLDEPALQTEPLPEGFYWQWPWNDIVRYDVTWVAREEQVDVLTAEALHVQVTAAVVFLPKSKELHRLVTEVGPTYYEDVIQPNFVTFVRSEFAKHNHNALAADSPAIEQTILTQLQERTADMPWELGRVAIRHIEFDARVTTAIAQKLSTQQQAAQKEFEVQIATRDAEIARTAAQGRADSIRIQAEGEAQAIVLRGNAQAQAQEAIAKTLTPEYVQFKAFDNPATRYYFVPLGRDGLPLILGTDAGAPPASAPRTEPTPRSE